MFLLRNVITLLFIPLAVMISDAVKLTVEFLATFFLLETTDCRFSRFQGCPPPCSSCVVVVLGTATILHPGLVALDSRVLFPPPKKRIAYFGHQLLP
jgi:hypothetical protein